jgi:hypothetical protein
VQEEERRRRRDSAKESARDVSLLLSSLFENGLWRRERLHKRPETVERCARGSVGRDDAKRIRRKTFLVVKSEGATTATTPAAFATKRGRGDFFEAQPIFILRG